MRPFGKEGKRNFCCKTHKVCIRKGEQKRCKNVRNNCKFVGPAHTTSYSMKCTWEHYSKGCNGYVKREKCCGVVKNCIGTNCQHVKGQCKFAGKEKHVFPTKKIDQHSFDEKKPEEHKRAHKKHIHKSGKKDFEIVKRVHRASCKGEYKCIVKRLKKKQIQCIPWIT